MTPSPFLVQIGPLAIRWYSVMIVLGAIAAAWIANREARRRGQDPEVVWQLLPWVLVCVAEWGALRTFFRRDLTGRGAAAPDAPPDSSRQTGWTIQVDSMRSPANAAFG